MGPGEPGKRKNKVDQINMDFDSDNIATKTTTDVVYEKLYEDIVSLKLRPGEKLSETDVAKRFNISRQPVRNAFTRLGNMDLLVIRPQKATEVRGFSLERIAHDRFVRMAVELEVVRCAYSNWTADMSERLEDNLHLQEQSIKSGDLAEFHALDYNFHQMLCEFGGHPHAFNIIYESKQKLDRLCVLSLEEEYEATSVLEDHRDIFLALSTGNSEAAVAALRLHLHRLDATISNIHRQYPDYFE